MADTPRHRARELVLKALYAYEQQDAWSDENLERIIGDERISEKNLRFVKDLFRHVVDNLERVDGIISKLARNWDLSRIAVLDRNILRMAIIEVEKMPDVPVKVVINEAIELAKTFSTRESSAFVNGLLDNYVKQVEGSKKA
ncbi:MAG: transcription antitermination factor NusB [candidate division Zixibacteria bacterium]|nr:transcription antitermination factor NusB [candidate division Zixibacteria bacterium]